MAQNNSMSTGKFKRWADTPPFFKLKIETDRIPERLTQHLNLLISKLQRRHTCLRFLKFGHALNPAIRLAFVARAWPFLKVDVMIETPVGYCQKHLCDHDFVRKTTFGKSGQYKSIKHKARRLTARAIRLGLLLRPKSCELCANDQSIQAHHRNYFRPLWVTWLCRKCHGEAHR